MKETRFPTKNYRSAKKITQLRQVLKRIGNATFVVEMYIYLPQQKVFCETVQKLLYV